MKIDVNNITINYEKFGKGQPFIFLHGNGGDHNEFKNIPDLMSNMYELYLVDSRGHGESSKVGVFSYYDMAMDIICMIDKLSLEKPLLYGYSDGGIIGLIIALKRPDLLSKLMISGANISPWGIKYKYGVIFRYMNFKRRNPLLELMIKEPHISKNELRQITIPVLVLAGEHDLIRKKHTLKIASNIKNSTCKILPGEDHGSYVVDNQKLVNQLKEYLKNN